jgi:hypothetical protein
MRLSGGKLDPKQSYSSDWIGDRTGGHEESVSGDGAPVVGVFGNQDEQRVLALGVIYLKNPTTTAKARPAAPRVEKPAPPAEKPVEERLEPAAAPRAEDRADSPLPVQPIQPQIVFRDNEPVVHRDPKRHYELTLPDGWREMTSGEMDLINQFLRQRGLDKRVQFEAGFRPRSTAPGSYPYILVQVKNPPTSYEEVERSMADDLKAPLKEARAALGSLAGELALGSAVLDRTRNRIVLRMNMDVPLMGKVESFTVCHLGSEAVVAVHCYALKRDFEKYLPFFIQLNDTLQFDRGYAFNPGGSGVEAIGKALTPWLPYVIFAGVTLPIFLGLLIFFIHKGHSANRPLTEGPAGACTSPAAVVPSPPRHEGE